MAADGLVNRFVVGVVIIVLCAIGFGLFISHGAAKYSTPDYDNTTFNEYQALEELTNLSRDVEDSTSEIKDQEGAIDTIGSFFTSSYNAFKITTKIFNIFFPMGAHAIDALGLGIFGESIKVGVMAIILLTLIISGIFYVIFKVKA